MKDSCVSCGKELDCVESGECWSDNANTLTHSHLGGMYCRDCFAKVHPFCFNCKDKPLAREWAYCPWCGKRTPG